MKKMRMTGAWVFMIVWTVLPTLSAKGAMSGAEGHGGGALVCDSGSSERVQMYDLYEGSARYLLSMSDAPTVPADVQIENALTKIAASDPVLGTRMRTALAYFEANHHEVYNTDLPRVPDANLLLVPQGCRYEQLAIWDDQSGKIFLNGELFDQMNSQDQTSIAALAIHESAYAVARLYGATNSDFVREFTAQAFSDGASPQWADIREGRLTAEGQEYLVKIQPGATTRIRYRVDGAWLCGGSASLDGKVVASGELSQEDLTLHSGQRLAITLLCTNSPYPVDGASLKVALYQGKNTVLGTEISTSAGDLVGKGHSGKLFKFVYFVK